MEKTIIIHGIEEPSSDLNEEIQWLCNSLGLFSKRDKEKSCFRIFLGLIKNKKGLTSDEMASGSNLSRATVIHHLDRLIASNLVIMRKNKYVIRTASIEDLTEDIERDIIRIFKNIKEVSKKIDNELEMREI